MDIPLESTRPSSKRSRGKRRKGEGSSPEDSSASSGVARADQQPVAVSPPLEIGLSAPATSEAPIDLAVAWAPDQPSPTAAEAGPVLRGGVHESAGAGGSLAGQTDPFTEAPKAVWYVRPASGGQFGPANGEVMGTWVAEGRVSPDSLVWREGWRDWREAAAVFPQLGGTNYIPGMQDILPQEPLEYHPVTATYARPGQGKSGAKVGLIIAIVISVALILLAILLAVVYRG
jgi:hypothetical protein